MAKTFRRASSGLGCERPRTAAESRDGNSETDGSGGRGKSDVESILGFHWR
jgi:hypothetical protein